MWTRIVGWLDERLDLTPIWRGFMDRKVPQGIGWFHTFGSATLFLLAVQFATGIFLTVYYSPANDHAYQSVRFIGQSVPFGEFVRGIHRWSASFLVVIVGLHMLRAFLYGAYKYPREATWVTGAVLLLIVLAFAFTGYLLPYDQKAYWATTVGTNIAGAAPFVGGWALRLLRGGTAIGAMTLQRFYGFHIWLLPASLVVFVVAHLFMVIRQGIAAPPRREPLDLGAAADGLPMRERYEREYAMEKRAGHPFYLSVLKDAVFMLVLFVAIAILAVAVGNPLDKPADPNSTTYVPRPDWYFLNFFQLLWYLKGNWEPLYIFLIVTGAVLVVLFLPFYDRSPQRHPARRPFATACAALAVAGILGFTYIGAQAPAPPGTTAVPAASSPVFAAGAQTFQAQGCANCHQIAGAGGTVGPNLSHIGTTLTRTQLTDTITHGTPKGMPAFSTLTPAQLNTLVDYLSSLK
jgi:ubiquinol-cytochrome c reductase cytochrome b subunit